ncbi:MAG: hypothetical protein QXR53_03845 [Candidatus Norongarragalinales archaeon]
MYHVVSVKPRQISVHFHAYRGVCNSTGNVAWLCSDNASSLEQAFFLLRKSKLENPESVVLLDGLLNKDESVVLISPSDGIGKATRLKNESILFESRGKKFIVFKSREKYAGVFRGL